MKLQELLNSETMDMLPRIKAFMKDVPPLRDQILHVTLRNCMNCSPAIADMTNGQLQEFQLEIINYFTQRI
jgi:hypothetical protein